MQISVPIKTKTKQQTYSYSIVESSSRTIKGKANVFDTWTEMKKNVKVPPETLVFMTK